MEASQAPTRRHALRLPPSQSERLCFSPSVGAGGCVTWLCAFRSLPTQGPLSLPIPRALSVHPVFRGSWYFRKMLSWCWVGNRGRLFLVLLQHVHYRAAVSCWKYLVGTVKNEVTYLGLTEAEAKRGKTQPRESGQGLYFLVGQFHVKFRVTRPERAYL